MKADRKPDVSLNFSKGVIDIYFECVGEEVCGFALCAIMPPDGNHPCAFKEWGSCRNLQAQTAAINSLRIKLAKEERSRLVELGEG